MNTRILTISMLMISSSMFAGFLQNVVEMPGKAIQATGTVVKDVVTAPENIIKDTAAIPAKTVGAMLVEEKVAAPEPQEQQPQAMPIEQPYQTAPVAQPIQEAPVAPQAQEYQAAQHKTLTEMVETPSKELANLPAEEASQEVQPFNAEEFEFQEVDVQ